MGMVGLVASCHRPGDPVPSLLSARPPQDPAEERAVRKLATSRHAPGDWIARARMISRSWDGARTSQIAAELHCHPQTVRERIKRFNAEGLDGLGDRPGAGRKPRLTEHERSQLIAWSSSHRRDGCAARPTGAGTPTSPIRRPTGPWIPSPRPPRRLGSRCSAARSAASCWPRGSAGAGRAPGPSPATRSSPQKDRDRRALHPSAGPCDGRLRR
jgi:hypothetical protein